MKLSKKLLAAACASVLLAGASAALPQSIDRLGASLEVYAETYGDYEYTVLNDGTVEITGYIGSDTEAIIPSEIDGRKVTSIGDDAFDVRSGGPQARPSINLTSITIPNGVTRIGFCAFYDCVNLESINIPNSVTTIGDAAFFDCESLKSIIIPNGVTNIGMHTFYLCKSLSSVIIPDSVTSIGLWAFLNCESLTSITIPKSVTSIDSFAIGYDYGKDYPSPRTGFKIYCYPGTAAETYATENGIPFIILASGDANRDGKVNMKDLVLIQRYLNGWPIDIDLTACDLTGDNKVNMKDYVALQRQLNGWTV